MMERGAHQHTVELALAARGYRPESALRVAVLTACDQGRITPQLCADATSLCAEVERGSPQAAAATEIQALVSGAALRGMGIGSRCCRVADALVGELADDGSVPWSGMTVPGAEDRANARTGLVELRFPAADFWAVPAAAHELGHVLARAPHIGQKRGGSNPARRVIDGVGSPAQREELLCDFYGVYALGPGYAALMITDRLDPAEAAPDRPFPDVGPQATGTHPTPDKRVFVMLRALELLDEHAGPLNARHGADRRKLLAAWTRRRGRSDVLDGDTTLVLTQLAGRVWSALELALIQPFSPSLAGLRLADALMREQPFRARPDLRVIDVVAAAWRARMSDSVTTAAVAGIAARALQVAEAVAGSETRLGRDRIDA